MTLLPLALAFAASVQATDTVVELRRGDRIVVEQVSGSLEIRAWDRDALEVRTPPGEGALSVRRTGSSVAVAPAPARGRARAVDAALRVPAWADVEIGSRSLDVSVSGLRGALRVGNVNGDVRVQDVSGVVEVSTLRGEIFVLDARGPVRVSSQADDVTLRRVSGPIEAHSGDGDILLDDIRSAAVRAEAQDGDVTFSGTIAPRGVYAFFVHDGDATIAIPATSSARVSVSTFDGEFESDFTVRVGSFTSGRAFDFTLGGGDARIQIEVFDGEIRLLQRR